MKKALLPKQKTSCLCAALAAAAFGLATDAVAVDLNYIDATGNPTNRTSVQWFRIENSDDAEGFTLNDNYPNWYGVDSKDPDVTLSRRTTVEGDVNLVIADGCKLTVQGGFYVPEGSSLTIYGQVNGTGELVADASGRGNCAGIGGNDWHTGGMIVICGGKVTATGGELAAGIGGGNGGPGGRIDVHGGTVTASGGRLAAGIGGSGRAEGGFVTIHGGTVTAYGGRDGAGIGGGRGGDITVFGGMVTATGGTWSPGIGSKTGGRVQIIAGTVTVNGGENGAGIGGSAGATVVVNGGTVTATGGRGGAGIGGNVEGMEGGSTANGGTITIAGGTVTATGGENGAGIGGAGGGAGGSVTISGGTVTVNGGAHGAGIGGGHSGAGGTITISNGMVTATGGWGGAGIGSGFSGKGGSIAIRGGTVTAVGGANGAGVGSGYLGDNDSLTLYERARVTAGPNESEATISAASRRVNNCLNTHWVRIEPCTSHGFSQNGRSCPYCGAAYPLYAGETTLADGWHLVDASMRVETRIEVSGEANLLLVNGVELMAAQGFHVAGPNSLAVWAQSNDRTTAGKLTVPEPASCLAGIGGNDGEAGGTVTVNGGVLDVTGGYKSAAIGGGRGGAGGTITINGGFVTATGAQWGTGLGGGMAANADSASGNAGNIAINGGEVSATGGGWCPGIGAAGGISEGANNGGAGGTVAISGGTVTATGGSWSAGIGGGRYAGGVAVVVRGGTVTAAGGGGQAIGEGAGWGGGAGSLAIDGMKAFASAEATAPVAPEDRESVCRSGWARLEACTHAYDSQGVCTVCGMNDGPVAYLDPTDAGSPVRSCGKYADFTGQTELAGGWYAARGEAQTAGRVEVVGTVNLILCDGAELTAAQGFHVAGTNSLTVWAHSANRASAGKLTVSEPGSCLAGIGGNDGEAGGTVTVNGGVLDIAGGYKSAAIGGGRSGAGGTITINGGFVAAIGADNGTGIGGGMAVNASVTGGSAGVITINGGEVAATGGANGAGIGGGGGTGMENGSGGGTVVITGGTVAATGGGNAAGIGGGYCSAGCAVTISGGTVTAVGSYAQAIGYGWNGGDSGSLAIDGMRVFASASAAEPVATANRAGTCRGGWAKVEVCPHEYENYVCRWCGVPVHDYDSWAAANGVSDAWNATGDGGIQNVFRYAFDVPEGAFANPPLLDIAIEDGKAVVKTPPVAYTADFVISVVESGDVAGRAVTRRRSPDMAGRAEFPVEGAAPRFYRLAATPDSEFGGVQLWENGPYWAERNVGAATSLDSGYFFWWGDTVGYRRENGAWVAVDGSTSDFSFEGGNAQTFGKDSATLLSEGWIDSTGSLAAAHDAATAHLGAPWRMPTDEEFAALKSNCDFSLAIWGDVIYGMYVVGRGDYANRSIFIPTAGMGQQHEKYGRYWSSTPHQDSPNAAYHFMFDSDWETDLCRRGSTDRFIGNSIRPVRSPAR